MDTARDEMPEMVRHLRERRNHLIERHGEVEDEEQAARIQERIDELEVELTRMCT